MTQVNLGQSQAGLWWLPGTIGVGAIAALIGLAAYGIGKTASLDGIAATLADPTLVRIAGFTVFQAALSAAISVALALPFARAASRRPGWRPLAGFMKLGNLAFVTPVIIGVFGIVEVHGVTGWVNSAARALTGESFGPYVYGLGGILIAHAFFNMPFAARNFDRALAGIAPESWRLAAQLGMSSGQIFRLIEWPALARVFLPTAGIIFAMCFTSFAVVVTLGGGPAATILEVAIYQALRFDFDITRAAGLALTQFVLAAAIVGPLLFVTAAPAQTATGGACAARPDAAGWPARATDLAAVTMAAVVIIAPLAGILLPGIAAMTFERLADPALWRATGWSLAIAAGAGSIAFAIGLGILMTQRHLTVRRGRLRAGAALEAASAIILVAPPMLLGAGLFLALRGRVDLFAAAPFLVIAINAVAGLPFVLRLIGPDFLRAAEHHDRLAASLGLSGMNRWRLVDWPAIRPAAATALAVTMTLAAGDLGVIALFGTPDTTTLPLLIFQRMGAYRMDEAAVGVVVLIALCVGIFVCVETALGGRGRLKRRVFSHA
ncbi:Thiamin ABC transporter, transmembrane component [hydrothermal vent metagenome]|uniref:Thiamin ABC transporter, transmembrane component n=1 Tax=hydrothermal vent metagenome TaxID=652676 RepID=A0A3B0TJF2_9ZZZZ